MKWLPLLLLLAGCASGHPPVDVKALTREDVQAAATYAQSRQDFAGSLCYGALLEHLSAEGPARPEIKGVVSSFEALRMVVHAPAGSDTVKVSCMGLTVETAEDLIKLGEFAAKLAASGGMSAIGISPGDIGKAKEFLRTMLDILKALGVVPVAIP